MSGGGTFWFPPASFSENYSFKLSIIANDEQLTGEPCHLHRPGQLDGIDPALTLGDRVGPQLVLALVLPPVHDPEAHGLLFPVRLLGSVRVSSGGEESLAVAALCEKSLFQAK